MAVFNMSDNDWYAKETGEKVSAKDVFNFVNNVNSANGSAQSYSGVTLPSAQNAVYGVLAPFFGSKIAGDLAGNWIYNTDE
jgi:hypothetical protein